MCIYNIHKRTRICCCVWVDTNSHCLLLIGRPIELYSHTHGDPYSYQNHSFSFHLHVHGFLFAISPAALSTSLNITTWLRLSPNGSKAYGELVIFTACGNMQYTFYMRLYCVYMKSFNFANTYY